MKKEIDYMFAALKFEGAGAKFYTLEHGSVEMDVVEGPPKLGQLYDLFEDYHSQRPPTAKGYGQKIQIPGMVPVPEVPLRPRGQVGGVVGLVKAKYNPNGTTLIFVF